MDFSSPSLASGSVSEKSIHKSLCQVHEVGSNTIPRFFPPIAHANIGTIVELKVAQDMHKFTLEAQMTMRGNR